MAIKILVVGPIQGHIEKAFQKISKLHAKTDFAFAIVVGDLFSQDRSDQTEALLSGSVVVPLPTYFTVGDHELPEVVQNKLESAGELCPNLFYLGRKGTLTTSEGIKIVFLGGREVQSEELVTPSISRYDPLFLRKEAQVLHGANNAHILLTNQWPATIENGSNVTIPEGVDTSSSTTSISNLCAILKPRYHFSCSEGASWKREPFLWPMDYSPDAETQVTRFESMGNVGFKNSEWMSAFTLDPSKAATSEGAQRSAPFTTTSPRPKRKRDTQTAESYPGRFDRSSNQHSGGRNKKRRVNIDPNDCFMCLGKPTFSADMVVSIADESFLTSLRGPLSTADSFSQMKSTGNLMIIPMYHAADETSHGQRLMSEVQTEFSEMTRYRHALQHMLLTKGKGQLGAVCWEVNRTGIRHFHWQWIACPIELISKGLVDAAFKITAEKSEHEKFQVCKPDRLLSDRRSDYFRVWIWSPIPSSVSSTKDLSSGKNSSVIGEKTENGNTVISPVAEADAISSGVDIDFKSTTPLGTVETSMYFELPQDQRFNIQFGRTVMSSLLKLEHRADWRSVPATAGDEARDAEAWKEDFAEYDFAMG